MQSCVPQNELKNKLEFSVFSKRTELFVHELARGNGDSNVVQRSFILSKKETGEGWT